MSLLPFLNNNAGKHLAYPELSDVKEPGLESLQNTELHTRVTQRLAAREVGLDYDLTAVHTLPLVGRLVILSNDPMPGLSVLALLHYITQVRDDVRVIGANQSSWLDGFEALGFEGTDAEVSEQARTHLANEGVLLIQPVHFGQSKGVPKLTQERWPTEFLAIAEHSASPLLHIHVSSNDQPFLQQARLLYRGNSLIPRIARMIIPSTYDQKLIVGEVIDAADYKDLNLRDKFKAKLLRKQLYRIVDGKGSYFKTLPAIAPPEARKDLIAELKRATRLGETKDKKLIYLCSVTASSPLLREIGRLREQAFRLVGEGSGKPCDVDGFDVFYQHIVLWDHDDEELVGAYRLCETYKVAPQDLYTATLMDYQANADQILERGVELGRSFVQPKYWGSRSLDYLWTGIAAYIRLNPRVRYLLGAVSISNAFSQQAKDLLLGYYSQYYMADDPIIRCKLPYCMGYAGKANNDQLFDGLEARDAFVALRERLGLIGHAVPTLYKQYTELCEPGGTRFHGFNIDPDFQDCIDGLVVVDLNELKPLKRKRYDLLSHDFLSYDALS